MVYKIEKIFIDISLGLKNEPKEMKEFTVACIVFLLTIFTLFNYGFFSFKMSLTEATRLKAFIPMFLISIASSYVVFKILVKSIYKEVLFFNDIYEIVENEKDPTKEEFVELLNLIDEYEDIFIKYKLSSKGLKDAIFFYVELFFDMSEEEFKNYMINKGYRQ